MYSYLHVLILGITEGIGGVQFLRLGFKTIRIYHFYILMRIELL
jgi:hypothetical protein